MRIFRRCTILALALMLALATAALADNYFVNIEMATSEDIRQALSFTLDGATYTLPCTLQDFYDQGWAARNPEQLENNVLEPMYSAGQYLDKDGKSVWIDLANFTEEDVRMDAASVDSIHIVPEMAPDFALASGITCASTADEILAAYGTEYADDMSGKNDLDIQFNLEGESSTYNSITFRYGFDNQILPDAVAEEIWVSCILTD